MPFGMWTLVGPRNYVLDGGPDTPREGALLREMALGVSACYRALFPVALTLGFPRMLLISIPTGQLQMQSSVTLNFPNEKSPCKVDSRHNFSTTYCRNSLITKPVILLINSVYLWQMVAVFIGTFIRQLVVDWSVLLSSKSVCWSGECRGAAIDVKNKKGNTPLWLACNGELLCTCYFFVIISAVLCLLWSFSSIFWLAGKFDICSYVFAGDLWMTRTSRNKADFFVSIKCITVG